MSPRIKSRTTFSSSLTGLIFAAIVIALGTVSARATTVAEMSDDDLAVSARAIVEGRVLSQSSRFDPSHGAVFTYVELEVERVHKGAITTQRVVLKQLGGEDSGLVTVVHGAPRFSDGERVLLFLTTDADGALRVAHLCLGHFLLLGDGEQERVVRATSDARILGKAGATHSAPKQEFLARVHQALEERWAESMHLVAERYPEPIQAFPAELSQTVSSKGGSSGFTFLGQGFRWFQPDSGQSVPFKVNTKDGPSPSSGLDEAKAALEAWSTAPGSSLRLEFGGKSTGGGLVADGASVIAFGDPRREIDDPVNCGGVIARGGVTSASSTESVTIEGQTFKRILEADVVLNNGFECIFSSSATLAEVITHEVGHAIGLGHSSEKSNETNATLRDATMYFRAHADGRGGALREDDIAAARSLYRSRLSSAPPAIETAALPNAVPGASFEFELSAEGAGPFTWSISEGALPSGLTLSKNGVISGVAGAEGQSTFTVSVRDAANYVAARVLAITATHNPAPFLQSAKFDTTKSRLTLTGMYLESDARVFVNGTDVTDAVTVKFKAAKSRLMVSGATSGMRLRLGEANTVAVQVQGRTSNETRF